jgi:hypothetical protein
VLYIYSYGIYYSDIYSILFKYYNLYRIFFRRKNLKEHPSQKSLQIKYRKQIQEDIIPGRTKFPDHFWDLNIQDPRSQKSPNSDQPDPRGSIQIDSKGESSHPSPKKKRSKMADLARSRANGKGPKKKHIPRKNAIVEFWNTLPYVRNHYDPSSKVYRKASQRIRLLRSGKIGKKFALDPKWADRMGIPKKAWNGTIWSDKKIKLNLERLSKIFHPEYLPRDKSRMPRDLPTLIYNERSGKSLFIKYYYQDPTKADAYEDEEALLKSFEKATGHLNHRFTPEEKRRYIGRMNTIWEWYSDLSAKDRKHLRGIQILSPKSFLNYYLDFLESKKMLSEKDYPFSVSSRSFRQFIQFIDDQMGMAADHFSKVLAGIQEGKK